MQEKSEISVAETTDLCTRGHWTRHHTVGKHDGCGHCRCKGFDPEPFKTRAEYEESMR